LCHIRESDIFLEVVAMSHLTIAPNGRVVIPAGMRAALGVPAGGKVIARLVDGAVILEPVEAAVRRAQAMVRQYLPQGTGRQGTGSQGGPPGAALLSDELIAERRRRA
jgi:AbrB family looped-hinge helix DNA binding protein